MIIIFVFLVCITARDRERVNSLYGMIPNLVSGCIMVLTCGHNLKSTFPTPKTHSRFTYWKYVL